MNLRNSKKMRFWGWKKYKMKVKNHGYDVEHLELMVYKLIAQYLLGVMKEMILKIINKKQRKDSEPWVE